MPSTATAIEVEECALYPRRSKQNSSLRNLALGILLQALRDIVAPRKASNKEWEVWRQDALEWFFSEESYPGSFSWVCELLEMKPRDLRTWLHTYKKSSQERKREMAKKLIRFQIRH